MGFGDEDLLLYADNLGQLIPTAIAVAQRDGLPQLLERSKSRYQRKEILFTFVVDHYFNVVNLCLNGTKFYPQIKCPARTCHSVRIFDQQ